MVFMQTLKLKPIAISFNPLSAPIKEDDDCFVGGGGGERETENKKLEYNFMESKVN